MAKQLVRMSFADGALEVLLLDTKCKNHTLVLWTVIDMYIYLYVKFN